MLLFEGSLIVLERVLGCRIRYGRCFLSSCCISIETFLFYDRDLRLIGRGISGMAATFVVSFSHLCSGPVLSH